MNKQARTHEVAPVVVPARARRSASQRWSARSSVEWIGAEAAALGRSANVASAPGGAVRARVHYRVNAVAKRVTFSLDKCGSREALILEVAAFQTLLAAAHVENWDADDKGRPVTPATRTRVVADLPARGVAVEPTPVPTAPAVVPVVAGAVAISTVADLARWALDRHRGGLKRRTGERRAPKTVADYESALSFLLAHARYDASDPRCADPRVEPGDVWLLDPEVGVNESDLLRLIGTRAHVNLRIRQSNEARLRKWGASGGEVPELREEVASARTIEAFARTVAAMFTDGAAHKVIAYQPWTAVVAEEVPHAATVSYSQRTVVSAAQVNMLADTMASVQLTARTPEGVRATCDGSRFSAMVWVAGRMGLRPEEAVALRDSWVILDGPDPRIVLHSAEVYEPRATGRVRVRVPLKHRQRGEVRVVRPDASEVEEFVRVMSVHRKQFVAGDDRPDEDGGYFFTNSAGEPIELSNFGRWWSAMLEAVPAEHNGSVLTDLPFRRLRAAAITHWLITHALSTHDAAKKAGNSQMVIEKHYRGVLDAREVPERQVSFPAPTAHFDAPAQALETLTAADLAALSGPQLGALTDLIRAAHQARAL